MSPKLECEMFFIVTRPQIVQTLWDVIRGIQEASARPLPVRDEGMSPLVAVPGFDSLNCLEATVLLGEKIGRDLDDALFFQRREGRYVNIGEIADHLLTMGI